MKLALFWNFYAFYNNLLTCTRFAKLASFVEIYKGKSRDQIGLILKVEGLNWHKRDQIKQPKQLEIRQVLSTSAYFSFKVIGFRQGKIPIKQLGAKFEFKIAFAYPKPITIVPLESSWLFRKCQPNINCSNDFDAFICNT